MPHFLASETSNRPRYSSALATRGPAFVPHRIGARIETHQGRQEHMAGAMGRQCGADMRLGEKRVVHQRCEIGRGDLLWCAVRPSMATKMASALRPDCVMSRIGACGATLFRGSLTAPPIAASP